MGPEYVNVCKDLWVLNMSMCAKIYGSWICQYMPGFMGPEYVNVCQKIKAQNLWVLDMSMCARIYGS